MIKKPLVTCRNLYGGLSTSEVVGLVFCVLNMGVGTETMECSTIP